MNQICKFGVVSYLTLTIFVYLLIIPIIAIFKAFIFISHFLYLHKEQQKMANNAIFFLTNFLSISESAFIFKRSFCEKSLLKSTLRHVCTSCVDVARRQVAENDLSIMEKKKSCKVAIQIHRQETKLSLHFSLNAIIFPTVGFKLIDISIFQALMFALRCAFCNKETLARKTRIRKDV